MARGVGQEKLLKRRRAEKLSLEEDDNDQMSNQGDSEELSEDFKRFIEAKAKSTINSLFGDLLEVVEGKVANPLPAVGENGGSGNNIVEVEEAFENLRRAISGLKIPDNVTSSIRREFLASKGGKETSKETKSTGLRKKLNRDNFKIPSSSSSPAKPTLLKLEPVKSSGSEASLTPHKLIKPIKSSGSEASLLTPITSDRSSGSGRSSEKGKQVTFYTCPFAPACDFTLSKAEMREMTRASQHLIKEHKVTSEDTNAALRANNQKYKFGKIKQLA